MPSAGGLGLKIPRGSPVGSFKHLEDQFVVKGGAVFSGSKGYAQGAAKTARSFLRNPFAKKAASTPIIRKPPSITANPVQAGEDVVRAVAHAASPAAAKPPVAGRTFQYVKTGLVTAGVVGGAVYGPGLIKNAGNSFGQAAASAGAGVGEGAGAAAQGTFSGLGAGLADLFSGAFTGAGVGVGQGVGATLAGVGEGLKKVALPAVLFGLGFLAFTALKKK